MFISHPLGTINIHIWSLSVEIRCTDRQTDGADCSGTDCYNHYHMLHSVGYNHLKHAHTYIPQLEISTNETGSHCSPVLWQTLFTSPFDHNPFLLLGSLGIGLTHTHTNTHTHTHTQTHRHTSHWSIASLQAW